LKNVVSRETDVREVLAKVALGEADAGFVYSTDAKTVSSKVKVIRVPAWARPKVQYGICVVSRGGHKLEARAFIKKGLSPAGQRRLRAYGFLPRVKPRKEVVGGGTGAPPGSLHGGLDRDADVPGAADHRDLRPHHAGSLARPVLEFRRPRRLHRQPEDEPDRPGVHRPLRHSDRVLPGDSSVPGTRGGNHSRGAAAHPAARGRGDRLAGCLRPSRPARLDL